MTNEEHLRRIERARERKIPAETTAECTEIMRDSGLSHGEMEHIIDGLIATPPRYVVPALIDAIREHQQGRERATLNRQTWTAPGDCCTPEEYSACMRLIRAMLRYWRWLRMRGQAVTWVQIHDWAWGGMPATGDTAAHCEVRIASMRGKMADHGAAMPDITAVGDADMVPVAEVLA